MPHASRPAIGDTLIGVFIGTCFDGRGVSGYERCATSCYIALADICYETNRGIVDGTATRILFTSPVSKEPSGVGQGRAHGREGRAFRGVLEDSSA